MLSITRLKVLRDDMAAIEGQLGSLALQMPQAVRGMAVILDSEVPLSLAPLVGHLRGLGMELVGVAEGPIENEARALGLAVLSKDAGRPTSDSPPACRRGARGAGPGADGDGRGWQAGQDHQ